MQHLTNVPKEDVSKIKETWPSVLVEGPPEATEGWSVEDLKADNVVGVYAKKDNEINGT